MIRSDVVRRPPLVVVFVAVAVIALGETSGAVIGGLRPSVARWAAAQVAAHPQAHGLTGSAEYDDEVRDRALFPVGYLVYAVAVLTRGREDGIALAETWVLTPLGVAAILGLAGLAVSLMWGAPTWPPTPPIRSEAPRHSRGAPRPPDS